MATPHPFTHARDGHDGSELRTQALLEAAERETNEIVAATAMQIHQLVLRAQRDLTLLKRQVDVTVSGIDSGPTEPAGAAATRSTPRFAAAKLSPAVRDALVSARRELDGLIDGLGGQERTLRPPARRLGTKSMVLMTLVIVTWGGAWGVATRWMTANGGSDPHAPVPVAAIGTSGIPPASPTRVAVAPDSAAVPGATPATASAERDDLRLSAERWLQAYFDRGETPSSQGTLAPAIHDERQPSERVVAAARRVVAPARVDVFGDAAVLSTSVTEYLASAAAPGGEVVSLVSQLWTRTAGQWHLDEVRIVSARGAESAFRR